MIIQEHFYINGKDFIRTYSNAGRYVVGGQPHGEYLEATDPAEFNRQYVEGELINEYEIDDIEALSILLGGNKE